MKQIKSSQSESISKPVNSKIVMLGAAVIIGFIFYFTLGIEPGNQVDAEIKSVNISIYEGTATVLPEQSPIILSDSAASRRITSETFSELWPLTVADGELSCHDDGSVTFQSNGITYAVNETAKGFASRDGYSGLEPIWKEQNNQSEDEIPDTSSDDTINQSKMPLNVLLSGGRALCSWLKVARRSAY